MEPIYLVVWLHWHSSKVLYLRSVGCLADPSKYSAILRTGNWVKSDVLDSRVISWNQELCGDSLQTNSRQTVVAISQRIVMNDDKSVFIQPQVVNDLKEKTTSMPNKQLSSLRASFPGAPRGPGAGKGRGEGELSLSFLFFFTARAPRRADRFCRPQANSNPNYEACIKSCFSGFTNRVLQKRQILKLSCASPEPPFLYRAH